MRKIAWMAVLAFVGAAILWSMIATESDPVAIGRGLPNILKYLRKMFPPHWQRISELLPFLSQSLQISLVSIFWSTIGGLVLGLAAARNVNPSPRFAHAVRILLGILRGIPSLLYALIFVCMVGLGPLPGVMGLTCHTVGALGRYFAEAFELADREPIEAAQIDGATRLQVVRYVLIPGAMPLLVGYTLYYFEAVFRQSTILGLVGAGGIGMPLMMSIKLFRYQDAAMALLLILTTIFVMDRISVALRSRYLEQFKRL